MSSNLHPLKFRKVPSNFRHDTSYVWRVNVTVLNENDRDTDTCMKRQLSPPPNPLGADISDYTDVRDSARVIWNLMSTQNCRDTKRPPTNKNRILVHVV